MYLNPFLFILLKKMVELECELKYDVEPTIAIVKEYMIEAEGDDKSANAIGEYVRKMWSKKIFKFPEFYLDRLVLSIKHLGKYESWDDFVKKESRWGYARYCESLTDRKFRELDNRIKRLVNIMAGEEISTIYFRFGKEQDAIARKKGWRRMYDYTSWNEVMVLSKEEFEPVDKEFLKRLGNSFSPNSY